MAIRSFYYIFIHIYKYNNYIIVIDIGKQIVMSVQYDEYKTYIYVYVYKNICISLFFLKIQPFLSQFCNEKIRFM